MSVTRFKRGSLLVVASLLLLGLATPVAACDSDGRGSTGRFECPVEPPSFNGDKGEPDPRGRPLTDEQLWAQHCSPRWDNEDPEDNNFFYDVRPIDPEFNEYRDLDPTGEYVTVWAVCDGPKWRTAQDQYGYGPQGANFDHWYVAVVDPVPVEEVRDEGLPAVEGEVAAREVIPGEMAPPADAGVVNTKTWLWLENDFDDTVYAEAERGNVTVWVEAVPTNTVFEVDGEEIARCEGSGTPYTGGPLSADTDCFYAGFEKASSQVPFEGTVTIEWVFHWGMGDDYYGEFHTYDATTDLPWTVDEVFATETG